MSDYVDKARIDAIMTRVNELVEILKQQYGTNGELADSPFAGRLNDLTPLS